MKQSIERKLVLYLCHTVVYFSVHIYQAIAINVVLFFLKLYICLFPGPKPYVLLR